MIRVSARDTFGVYGDTKAESIKALDTTLITIHVRAFPSTDHSNCIDVSKCYLACLFPCTRLQEVPKHISVRGRLNEII